MAKEFAVGFYKSKAWRECRKAYISSVFGLCEKCRELGHILHHKITLTPDNINDPEVTLNWDNLQFLCLECHNSTHGVSEPVRDGLGFDSYGNLVER